MADKKDDGLTKAETEALETAPTNTEDARKQSAAMLKKQESAKPEPSQDEADEIKKKAAAGGDDATYKTRDVKKS